MPRAVLIHTDEIVGLSMAGPGMRAWRMAEALAAHQEVTLYTSAGASIDSDLFRVFGPDDSSLDALIDTTDVVVHQGGSLLLAAPQLLEPDSQTVVVLDLYGAWIFEQQEQRRAMGRPGDEEQEGRSLALLRQHLLRADHILCASERQRALWIGHLVALGRLTHELYDSDPTLNDLVTIVPFGLDKATSTPIMKRIKGIVPGIGTGDKVVLWGGGIHDWFDPLTAIRAMAFIAPRHPEVRLLFLGTRHPNPNVPTMQMVDMARDLADALGLLGSSVIFNDGWVPLAERAGWFADSDVGISSHHASLETEFSFRTRMLDFFQAGLPVVVTGGDVLAQLVVDRELGAVVSDNDAHAVARALEALLYNPISHEAARRNITKVAEELAWSRTLTPFVELIERAAAAPGQGRTVELDTTNIPTRAEIAALREEGTRARAETEDLRHQLEDIRNSTSWRITAPLRKGVLRFRRSQ